MGRLRKTVTSALVITGATAVSAVTAGAAEQESTSWLDEDVQFLEMDMIEKALRNYTNPLHKIQNTMQEALSEETIIYEVQEGDTLSGIGYKFGIPVSEIARENDISNKHRISIGQKLKIRLKEKEYVVKYGETITEISEKEGITKEEIAAYNPLLKKTDFRLYPGQALKLPTLPPEPAHQPLSTPKKKEHKSKVIVASRSMSTASHSGHGFSWPIKGIVTSKFGTRWGRMHNGIDISNSGKTSTPIQAAKAGVVTDAYHHQGGYGKLVIIDHGDGYESYYAHLSRISVKEGQKIAKGETLGYMGRTGRATGYHLHFEIRKNNKPQNPLKYLPKN